MSRWSANATKTRFIYGSNFMENDSNYDIDNMFDTDIAENGSCNNDCANCMLECPYKAY